MKKFILLLVFLTISFYLLADTHIEGGNVYGTWNLFDSPYIIDNDITISNGETLEIEAGVIIKFSDDTHFYINGKIIAMGTEQNNIKFIKNENQLYDIWNGIFFDHTNAENDSSYFDYCVIKNTIRAFNIDSFSKLTINHSEIAKECG